MKGVVGFGFFMLFLGGFAFVMLQGKQMAEQRMGAGGVELTATNWRPVSMRGDPVPQDSGLYVVFEVDGSIRGHGGCNGFFGSLVQNDDGLSVGPLGSTRMACEQAVMNREMAFLEVVQELRDFATGNYGMRILDSDGEILAEFVANSGGE